MGIFGFLKKKKEPEYNFNPGDDLSGKGMDMNSGQGFGTGLEQSSNPGFGADQTGLPNEGFGNNPANGGFPGNPEQNSSSYPDDMSVRDLPGPSYNQQQPGQQAQSPVDNKDMQIISSKLDAIKSSLDVLNQRVDNLERIAKDEGNKQPKRRQSW